MLKKPNDDQSYAIITLKNEERNMKTTTLQSHVSGPSNSMAAGEKKRRSSEKRTPTLAAHVEEETEFNVRSSAARRNGARPDSNIQYHKVSV